MQTMDTAEKLWEKYRKLSPSLSFRDSYKFDERFYLENYPDTKKAKSGKVHFDQYGKYEGRFPNTFARLKSTGQDREQQIKALVTDPEFLLALEEGPAEAFEVAFELMLQPETCAEISTFSHSEYLIMRPEVEGLINPVEHYMMYGIEEMGPLFTPPSDNQSEPSDKQSEPFVILTKKKVKVAKTTLESAPKVQESEIKKEAVEIHDDKVNEIWLRFAAEDKLFADRNRYDFDDTFYGNTYPDLKLIVGRERHFMEHGRKEGRIATKYQQFEKNIPSLAEKVLSMLTDRELKKASKENPKQIAEVVFELMRSPLICAKISNFSVERYLDVYPDVAASSMDPLFHYLKHGMDEGRSIATDDEFIFKIGRRSIAKNKRNCFVSIHELSRTGSPVVALELIKSAQKQFNVFVLCLRGGEMENSFVSECSGLIETATPTSTLPDIGDICAKLKVEKIDFAILNSIEAAPFGVWLARQCLHYAIYIHEYADYTLPIDRRYTSLALADRIIFSSTQVRDNWQQVLTELNIHDSHVSIVPQRTLPKTPPSARKIRTARQAVSKHIGLNIDKTTVIYGAGHADLRKGTDLFALIAANILRKSESIVFIWIGDGFNDQDYRFGYWVDIHLTDAGLYSKDRKIFTIPPGEIYKDICLAADCLLLTSRRDPLPNVVFDAIEAGARVLKFEGMTGFEDLRYQYVDALSTASFYDLPAAFDMLLSMPRKLDRPIDMSTHTVIEKVPFEHILGELQKVTTNDIVLENVPPRSIFTRRSREEDVQNELSKVVSLDRRMYWPSSEAALEALHELYPKLMVSFDTLALKKDIKRPSKSRYRVFLACDYSTPELELDVKMVAVLQDASKVIVHSPTKAICGLMTKKLEALKISSKCISLVYEDDPFSSFLNASSSLIRRILWGFVDLRQGVNAAVGGPRQRSRQFAVTANKAVHLMAEQEADAVAPYLPYCLGWYGSRVLNVLGGALNEPLPPHPGLDSAGVIWLTPKVANAMKQIIKKSALSTQDAERQIDGVNSILHKLWPFVAQRSKSKLVYLEVNRDKND